ncbi:hypothetical protein [Nocardia paucivorans]|uniref:hypothetical protein n=1 Tax=Nocardia paucivorans TaxID=114259 RepID=UPI0012FB76E3|nr:hypothetical protein [Nocardia paucivorans]
MINFDDSMGGVGFLTGKFEAGVMKLWGHRRHRAANREFLPFWVASDVETRSERLIRNRDEEPRPAPYFDPETDAELLTVTVHCTGNAFEIPYRDPKTGEKQLVYVDGIVLGRLVEMSEDFRTACVQHPNSPLLLVSCSAGTVGGDAHLLFANYIHGQGFTGDVWAGQGIMSINARGEMGIRTQVAPDGTMISPFSVIRATEKHNVVPWSAGTVE